MVDSLAPHPQKIEEMVAWKKPVTGQRLERTALHRSIECSSPSTRPLQCPLALASPLQRSAIYLGFTRERPYRSWKIYRAARALALCDSGIMSTLYTEPSIASGLRGTPVGAGIRRTGSFLLQARTVRGIDSLTGVNLLRMLIFLSGGLTV